MINNSQEKLTLNANVSQNLSALTVTITAKLTTFVESNVSNNLSCLSSSLTSTSTTIDRLLNWFLSSSEGGRKKTKTYVLTSLLYFIKLTEDYNHTNELAVVLEKYSQNPQLLHCLRIQAGQAV